MPIVSAEHAHLRPFFRRLAADRALVSTETQFATLVEAVAEQAEHHADAMRGYMPAARAALIVHLSKAEQQRPVERVLDLWVMQKGMRTLSCVAVYLPHGVDVRLVSDGETRRTQLVKDGPSAGAVATAWHDAAHKLGWRDSMRPTEVASDQEFQESSS